MEPVVTISLREYNTLLANDPYSEESLKRERANIERVFNLLKEKFFAFDRSTRLRPDITLDQFLAL